MKKEWYLELRKQQELREIEAVISCNQFSRKFGVHLSEAEAIQILEARKTNLKEQERIEFGEGVLSKIIFLFCDSSYIYQDNYVETLSSLQEIFYLYKNESLDELSDDELLEYMKQQFEQVCHGSLEYLEGSSLDEFCRNIRENGNSFMGGVTIEE